MTGGSSGYRIAVDTGGTFTDVVVCDPAGAMHIGKGSTQLLRAYDGIREGLEQLAPVIGVSVEECLTATDFFTYGTTRALNAIVEGKTARTAFLTTAGFPDTLLLREGGKQGRFKQQQYGAPYVPRYLTYEISERVDAEGGIVVPLDEGTVLEAIEALKGHDCEAVGVSLIWSIVNPSHELRIGELLEEHLPGVPYTLSHQLNPIVREYRRASATVIDASLKSLMQEHVSTLEQDLHDAGFRGELFVATSFGGSWRPSEIIERPIYAVGSGPSMAPVAALTYARAELDEADALGELLVCDTGGTTFDVSLVSGGEIQYTPETWLGGKWTGHITGTRSVDVQSIGAGGGSIAWIDPGGLIRVGPQSAGADPGPACYGRGGTEPTVTDAALVLGYVDPDYFLGGHLQLDADSAHDAIERSLARPLSMTVEHAAHAALVVATANIVGAIRAITIAQGRDPRDLTIVAGGGACGLNIVPIARDLGCSRVLLPNTAAAFSAVGALHADIISEFAASVYAETRALDRGAVNDALAGLDQRARSFIDGIDEIRPARSSVAFSVDARYPGQVWDIAIPLPAGSFESDADVDALERIFHDSHQRIFAVSEPNQYVECLTWKARATAELATPALPRRAAGGGSPEPHAERPAYFGTGDRMVVPHYAGGELAAGSSIVGPAVIQEPTTTIVLYPGSSATIASHGSYLLDVGTDPSNGSATA
jgi:N-methylhydantoinase A